MTLQAGVRSRRLGHEYFTPLIYMFFCTSSYQYQLLRNLARVLITLSNNVQLKT